MQRRSLQAPLFKGPCSYMAYTWAIRYVYGNPSGPLVYTIYLYDPLSSVFWWLNRVRLYSLYEILYPERRIESYSIMGTIVSPNKIRLLWDCCKHILLRTAMRPKVAYYHSRLQTALYWVAVKELKLSSHTGYIYIVINMVSPIHSNLN